MSKSDEPVPSSDKPDETSKKASDELTEDDLKKVSAGFAAEENSSVRGSRGPISGPATSKTGYID